MSGLYTIELHQHRLAAWDAATSARASKLCRFTVQHGVGILEASRFTPEHFAHPDDLPTPADLDQIHAQWREAAIEAARQMGLTFTHGVAAKLINCYLKARFVCGGWHDHERVRCLHPPIDSLLLKELAKHNFGGFGQQWRKFEEQRWSKFDSATYQRVIDLIRQCLADRPLWMIEEHWAGYQ